MVNSSVAAGFLYAHHVPYALHHTNLRLVAGGVGTDGAKFVVANHAATAAVTGIVGKTAHGIGEMMYSLGALAQKMKRQPQGAATAYSRKRTDCIHRLQKNV